MSGRRPLPSIFRGNRLPRYRRQAFVFARPRVRFGGYVYDAGVRREERRARATGVLSRMMRRVYLNREIERRPAYRGVGPYAYPATFDAMRNRGRLENSAARRIQNIYRQRNARRAQVARRRVPFAAPFHSMSVPQSDIDIADSMLQGGGGGPLTLEEGGGLSEPLTQPMPDDAESLPANKRSRDGDDFDDDIY